jgi:hypothetical protein
MFRALILIKHFNLIRNKKDKSNRFRVMVTLKEKKD